MPAKKMVTFYNLILDGVARGYEVRFKPAADKLKVLVSWECGNMTIGKHFVCSSTIKQKDLLKLYSDVVNNLTADVQKQIRRNGS